MSQLAVLLQLGMTQTRQVIPVVVLVGAQGFLALGPESVLRWGFFWNYEVLVSPYFDVLEEGDSVLALALRIPHDLRVQRLQVVNQAPQLRGGFVLGLLLRFDLFEDLGRVLGILCCRGALFGLCILKVGCR